MGFVEVIKIVFIPAVIAAALYAFLAYVVVPLVQRHRNRYSQYLPIDSIGQSTVSVRERITDMIANMMLPRRHTVEDAAGSRRGSAADSVFENEAGDNMAGFDVVGSGGRMGGSDIARDGDGSRTIPAMV